MAKTFYKTDITSDPSLSESPYAGRPGCTQMELKRSCLGASEISDSLSLAPLCNNKQHAQGMAPLAPGCSWESTLSLEPSHVRFLLLPKPCLNTGGSSWIPVKRHCLMCHCQGFGSSGGGYRMAYEEAGMGYPWWCQLVWSSSVMGGTCSSRVRGGRHYQTMGHWRGYVESQDRNRRHRRCDDAQRETQEETQQQIQDKACGMRQGWEGGREAAVGDPCWSRDTPEGTVAIADPHWGGDNCKGTTAQG